MTTSAGPADLVVIDSPVHTVDPAGSRTDGVAVRDGRIVALGSRAAGDLIGPRTRVISEAGLVLPGFQDAHIHAPFAGLDQIRLDLRELSGRPAYLEAIGDYAAAHPDEDWVVGGGWAVEYFEGGNPTRQELDSVVPDRPAFLMNKDWHSGWANSAALAAAGITAATPDPVSGRYQRDPLTGEPTGALHEGAAHAFNEQFVPSPSTDLWKAAILRAQDHLLSLGITGWQDAWVTPDTLDAYLQLMDDESLLARVVGAQWWQRLAGLEQIEGFVAARSRTARTGGRAGRFSANTVKIMVDGVIENYTGALLEPYCRHPEPGDRTGLLHLDPEILVKAVVRLDDLGFQVHLHAIGDRAVREALDAVEAARKANGQRGNRHHIAHVQLIHPQDLPRFRELNVVANLQTYWAQSEPQMDEHTIPQLGAERAARQYPFADLDRAGVTLAMGSDWGVTTADPLAQLEVAVHRADPSTRHLPPFVPEQRLSLTTAVRAFTAGSAYVNHDDEAGSLQLGRRADLAVLDRDIFDGRIRPADARVTHTVIAGRVVFEGPSAASSAGRA